MEIKPCPFCGGRVYPMYSSKTEKFYIIHYKQKKRCVIEVFELTSDEIHSLSDAIEAWNRSAKNEGQA